jgi:tetratricopeptide (TPR) repeat protein
MYSALGRFSLFVAAALAIVVHPVDASAKKARPAEGDQLHDKAAPTVAAREKAKRAAVLFSLGRFEEAAVIYEQLYEEFPEQQALLYNLAQIQRMAGNHERALFLYRRYLANSPSASNRVEVERRIAELERAVAEIKKAQSPPNELAPPELPPTTTSTTTTTTATQTTATTPAAPAAATVSAAPAPREKPLYKKWWLWTAVVGGAVVVAGAITLGVVLARPEPFRSPFPDVGPGAAQGLQVRW